jgi:signal transduction histidine kinase/DNA-binding response OmpR family regulator
MDTEQLPPDRLDPVLRGGGELGARMRALDWAQTPLGPVERWPQALKTCVRIMLTSRQPIWIGWGPELTYLYNDPYLSIIGGKHPGALGRPTSEVWREIWPDIGPRLQAALGGQEGTYDEALLLIMERHGYPEETYYTFSYSPIPDDEGQVGGIFCANTDDTQRIIGERQLALLRELAAGTAEARGIDDAGVRSARALETNPFDLPFALLYLLEPDSPQAVLVATSRLARGHPAAPAIITLNEPSPWPLAEVVRTQAACLVPELPSTWEALPTGAWDRPPGQAVVLPIAPSGEQGRAGCLVVGLNPYRRFDDQYQGFLQLVAAQIAAAITNAQAYEEERQRAEALAELDRAKTQFFSNVSHELRTPLTLMLGPIEEVLAQPDSRIHPEQRVLIEVVHRNGLRLLKLVNSLLDFSRIEAGRAQASYQPTDLVSFTAELASGFRSAMEHAGLSFSVDCEPLPEPVYLDGDLWEKIVLNLLSNAFKFTLEGEVSVAVRASDDATMAELRVADTGVGIPERDLPLIFERFHRVEGGAGRSAEGTGIGLALVQELVLLHGGSIAVQSELGRGTVFTIRLPFGTAHLPADHLAVVASLPSTATGVEAYVDEALRWLPSAEPPSPGPSTSLAAPLARVLVADDNADMRDYVGRLLSERYVVEAVANGEAALAAALAHPPDLVVSDVMMPGLDGFGLVAALRADPRTQGIPIILLSARAGGPDTVGGLDAGADDYLVKPFSAQELLARVATHLELTRLRGQHLHREQEANAELNLINRTGLLIAAELDLQQLVQAVTDAATQLSGAQFGAFFYNVTDAQGERYTLYTVSGVPRERFSQFPMPRNTDLFGVTFRGEEVIRLDDVRQDPRYGKHSPYYGMPPGHVPVRSYLAVPVISRSGEVIGGLFFGHAEPGVFTERIERIVGALAAQAAIGIDNARLYEQAQQAIQVRDEFFSVAAHELRTPLTSLHATIQLLERRLQRGLLPPSESLSQSLQVLVTQSTKLGQLIGQLLDISRLDHGGLSLELQTVDLAILVSGVANMLQARSEKHQIVVRVPSSLVIEADPVRLEQVVTNLLDNAIKYSPGGGYIEVEMDRAGPDYAQIRVTDQGLGIPTDRRERIFERFYQAHTGLKVQGLGLGLYVSKQIIERHGGQISVESPPEGGTRFLIQLPVGRTDGSQSFEVAPLD